MAIKKGIHFDLISLISFVGFSRICPIPSFDVYVTLNERELEDYENLINERDKLILQKQQEVLSREHQIILKKQNLSDVQQMKVVVLY